MSGQIDLPGSTIITGRVSYNQGNLVNGQFSAVATTDGLVVAVLGTLSATLNVAFGGVLHGTTALNGDVTSSVVATASTMAMPFNNGKKGAVTLQVPTFGNFTLPVRQGETWTLSLLTAPTTTGYPAPDLAFYWVALGGSATAGGDTAASATAEVLGTAFRQLQHTLSAGGPVGLRTAATVADAQRQIDDRVGDFSRVLADSVGAVPDDKTRLAFTTNLNAIVCRASLDGTEAPVVEPAHLSALIASFADLAGQDFGDEQREMLIRAVRALVAINATQESRRDLGLIHRNIGFFIDNVAAVLGREVDARRRRLLTRALVRLVGDGAAPLDAVPAAAE